MTAEMEQLDKLVYVFTFRDHVSSVLYSKVMSHTCWKCYLVVMKIETCRVYERGLDSAEEAHDYLKKVKMGDWKEFAVKFASWGCLTDIPSGLHFDPPELKHS